MDVGLTEVGEEFAVVVPWWRRAKVARFAVAVAVAEGIGMVIVGMFGGRRRHWVCCVEGMRGIVMVGGGMAGRLILALLVFDEELLESEVREAFAPVSSIDLVFPGSVFLAVPTATPTSSSTSTDSVGDEPYRPRSFAAPYPK